MLPAEAVVNESPVLTQLTPGKVHRNLSVPQMVAVSLARGESKLAANGALVAVYRSADGAQSQGQVHRGRRGDARPRGLGQGEQAVCAGEV